MQAVPARSCVAAVLVADAVQDVVVSLQREGAAEPAPAMEIVTIL